MNDDEVYREVIDTLVRSSLSGQGQIRASWVREGKWPPGGLAGDFVDQLSDHERDVLAGMLADSFVSGVHEALVVLHGQGVDPFTKGYEGDPCHDFVGRLQGDWEWPRDDSRW